MTLPSCYGEGGGRTESYGSRRPFPYGPTSKTYLDEGLNSALVASGSTVGRSRRQLRQQLIGEGDVIGRVPDQDLERRAVSSRAPAVLELRRAGEDGVPDWRRIHDGSVGQEAAAPR